MLPAIGVCPRGTATLPSGESVEVRGLSRAEALQVQQASPDVRKVEILVIMAGCDVDEPSATSYWTATRQDDVEELVNAISKLSGLSEDEGKAAAVDSPSAQ